MFYCPHCGFQINDNSIVCPSCGGDLPFDAQDVAPTNTYGAYNANSNDTYSAYNANSNDTYGAYNANSNDTYGAYNTSASAYDSYDSYNNVNAANKAPTKIVQDGPKGKLAAILLGTIALLVVSAIICISLVNGYAKSIKGEYVCEDYYYQGGYYDFYIELDGKYFELSFAESGSNMSYSFIEGKYDCIASNLRLIPDSNDDNNIYAVYNKSKKTITIRNTELKDMVFKRK